MNEIDVTLSVVIDNTTSECEQVIQELMEKHRLAPDTMELILERVLANIRAVKCRLYASAIISKQSCKEEKVEKIGTVEEMCKDLQEKGIHTTVKSLEAGDH